MSEKGRLMDAAATERRDCANAQGRQFGQGGTGSSPEPRPAPTAAELREALMRCGALAISERVDGCVPKLRALRIREIAYRLCWPEDVTP